jgi:hypothetical protein
VGVEEDWRHSRSLPIPTDYQNSTQATKIPAATIAQLSQWTRSGNRLARRNLASDRTAPRAARIPSTPLIVGGEALPAYSTNRR